MIPTYGVDGARQRSYSVAAIERLEARGAVRVTRNFQGEIVAARRIAKPAPTIACQRTGLSRVRFTRVEEIAGRDVIAHKPLPYAAVDRALGHVQPRHVIENAVRDEFLLPELRLRAA